MRKIIDSSDYSSLLIGTKITNVLFGSDSVLLDFDAYELVLYHDSFWRVLSNDNVVTSTEELHVKCRYGCVDWPELFPPAIKKKIDLLSEQDEADTLALLQAHLDSLHEFMRKLVDKKVMDVNISPFGDLDIVLSDNFRLQAFASFSKDQDVIAYQLLK